jgi:hypothetical protein
MVFKKTLPKPNFTKPQFTKEHNKILSLPIKKTTISNKITDYCIFIYGVGKIGKTSFCGQFPSPLIAAFEPGYEGGEYYAVDMPCWENFVDIVDLLCRGEHDYLNLVIDNVQIAYNLCSDFIANERGFKNSGEAKDYGATAAEIRKEFNKQINRLIFSGIKPIFTAHAKDKKFESLSGTEFYKTCPMIPDSLNEILSSVVDILGYYNFYKKNRYLTIQGNDNIDAGHRLEKFFNTPDGIPIHSIPLGKTAKQAYTNLITAFQNKQKETFEKLI